MAGNIACLRGWHPALARAELSALFPNNEIKSLNSQRLVEISGELNLQDAAKVIQYSSGIQAILHDSVVIDWSGEDCLEELISKGSTLIGLGARDTLRLEAGLCLYGHDINENTSPVEANLKWAISKNRINDNFIGSHQIKKQIEEGVSKLRVGIKPETRVIARESTKIFDEKDNEIGKVTSGTFGPSVNASIAMGYISNSHSKTDTKVFLEVRGKKVPANVCDLPFYKKSYVKGEANV